MTKETDRVPMSQKDPSEETKNQFDIGQSDMDKSLEDDVNVVDKDTDNYYTEEKTSSEADSTPLGD